MEDHPGQTEEQEQEMLVANTEPEWPEQEEEPEQEQVYEPTANVYEIVSLGWGIRRNGSIISTGPKTEMTKQARANAREDGAELHIFNTAGKVTRKEYF